MKIKNFRKIATPDLHNRRINNVNNSLSIARDSLTKRKDRKRNPLSSCLHLEAKGE